MLSVIGPEYEQADPRCIIQNGNQRRRRQERSFRSHHRRTHSIYGLVNALHLRILTARLKRFCSFWWILRCVPDFRENVHPSKETKY